VACRRENCNGLPETVTQGVCRETRRDRGESMVKIKRVPRLGVAGFWKKRSSPQGAGKMANRRGKGTLFRGKKISFP